METKAPQTRTGRCIYCRKVLEQTTMGYGLWLPKAHDECAVDQEFRESESRRVAEQERTAARQQRVSTVDGQIALGIPGQYHGAVFSDFGASAAKDLRDYYAKAGGMLTLTGQPGTGKTRALYAMARQAEWDGRQWKAAKTPILIKQLQAAAGASTKDEFDILAEYCKFPGLLLLDEFGQEKTTEFAIADLGIIIGSREEWGRATAVGSNLTLREIAEGLDRRIADRLAGGTVIEFKGKSKRLGK